MPLAFPGFHMLPMGMPRPMLGPHKGKTGTCRPKAVKPPWMLGQLFLIFLHIKSDIVLREFNLILPQIVSVSRERNDSVWRVERLLAVQGVGILNETCFLVAAALLILIAAYEGQSPAC